MEVQGNNIEVEFPDSTKEEIENGRFERKNALGRTSRKTGNPSRFRSAKSLFGLTVHHIAGARGGPSQ
jgi:hypothetical protein